MFESLRSLSDRQLLSNTDAIVVQDRQLTVRLLVHLHEIERRRLYLVRGYGSMFAYCMSHLKLSGPAVARRLRTARCLARSPELYALLESGEVNLTTVSMVAKYFKRENANELLSRIRGKSWREVKGIVAELEPRTLLPPDSIRPIVVPLTLTVAGDSEKTPSVPGDRRAGDLQKSPDATVMPSQPAKFERRAVVQFTAREEVIAKLEKVRALASHRLRGNASMEDVIELLADEFIKREDPAVREERREKRAQRPRPSVNPASARVLPARVRDQIFVRDKHQCTYVSPGGKRCESTHVLQVDHIQPIARGGASTIDNLRLLCAYHNRLEAERVMGRAGCRTSDS